MRLPIPCLAVAVFASLLAIEAPAATVTVTGGTGGFTNSAGAPLTVAKFDAGLGSLTSVTISYLLTTNFSGTFGNFSGAPTTATVSISGGSPFLKDAGGNLLASGVVTGTSAPIALAAGVGNAPGITNFSYNAPGVIGTLAPLSDIATLAAFTGAGNYTFTVGGSAGTGDTSGGTFFGGGINASDSVSVLYTYQLSSAVPEPASWALMLLGIGAVGARLRAARVWQPRSGFIATGA